jgi:hypothetical protein
MIVPTEQMDLPWKTGLSGFSFEEVEAADLRAEIGFDATFFEAGFVLMGPRRGAIVEDGGVQIVCLCLCAFAN